MRLATFLICALLTLPFAGDVSATEGGKLGANRGDILRLVKQLPDFFPVEEEMQALGFSGENLALAVKQDRKFYTDSAIAGYITDQVIGVYTDPETISGRVDGVIWPLIDNGLGHLSTGELKFYFQFEQALLSGLTPRQCGRIVRETWSDDRASDAMMRVAARMETSSLKEYYRIQFKAAKLGVSRRMVKLSKSTNERIEEQLHQAIERRIMASGDAQRLLFAAANLRRADNTRACMVGMMFYEAVMEQKGQALRDALIYMSTP